MSTPIPFTRRTAIKAALSVAGAGGVTILFGCSGSDSSKKMTAWGTVSFTKAGDRLLGQQMDDWAKDAGVSLEYTAVPGSDYTTKVSAAVEGKALPDLVMLQSGQPVYFGSQGHLADVSDLYAGLKKLGGGIWPQLDTYNKVDEKYFSVPMESDVVVLFSRLDICEQVIGERRAPKTLDEMEKIARRGKTAKLDGIALPLGNTADGNTVVTYLSADGFRYVNADGEPDVANDHTVAGLERLQRWWKDKLIPQTAPSADDSWNNQQYATGRVIFTVNAPSILASIESNKELADNTFQGLVPAGAKGSVQSSGCWSWAVSASGANQAAAKDLLKALMQPDAVEQVYEKVGGRWYPVYRDLAKKPYWTSKPAFAQFPTIIKNSVPDWAPAKASAKLLTQIGAVRDSYLPVKMVQRVLLQNTPPATAAKQLQDSMEQIFAEHAN